MQNKPNLQKSQMNVNLYNTTDYENISNWTLGENKPNSNPIKPNLKRAKMNINLTLTKDYEKKTLGERGKKQSQTKPNKAKFKKAKMNVTVFYIKDYENISNWAIYENKANFNPKQTQTKPISEAKKCCSPPLCCGIYKEKMIFCNRLYKKYQISHKKAQKTQEKDL